MAESQKEIESQVDLDRNVILIASGKGGVGKTWFSTTLAQALAEEGENVLLFDGDLGLANVDIQLGLAPPLDLSSIVAGKCSMEEAILPYEPGKFDILAGKSGGGQLASLSPQRLIFLKESLRQVGQKYDTVLVDLGAGVGGTVRVLSEGAPRCLVVTTDEPTAMTDAYAFIKVMRTKEPQMELQIMVNMAESEGQALRTYEILKKSAEIFLKYTPSFAGFVLRDNKVKDAIRHQTAILIRHPSSPAAEGVRSIARRILTGGKNGKFPK